MFFLVQNCCGSPQSHAAYLEHEPVPGLGHAVVLPFVVIGWGAVVLIPHQHLLQEEVGCELQGQGRHKRERQHACSHERQRLLRGWRDAKLGHGRIWLGLLWVSVEEGITVWLV